MERQLFDRNFYICISVLENVCLIRKISVTGGKEYVTGLMTKRSETKNVYCVVTA
jgi:hypothetical protein